MAKIPKIDKHITVRELRKKYKRNILIAPYFLKSFPFNLKDYRPEDRERIANRITKRLGGHGNFVRMFPHGVWESDDGLLKPFTQKRSGRYNLQRINREWEDLFLYSVGLFVERGWTVCIDVLENAQLHHFKRTHWALHWWNGDNSSRFFVPELDRRYFIHNHPYSIKGHWRDWDSPDKKWCSDYDLCTEEKMKENPKHYDDMNRNRATREFFLWWMDYLLTLLKTNFGNRFWVGHNEWQTAQEFHFFMADLYKRYGIGKNRRMTSLYYGDWYKSKKAIFTQYVGQVHGCYYWEDIEYRINHILPSERRFMFSSDGAYWGKYGKNYRKLRETIKYSLDRGLGFELNNDWWPDKEPNIYYHAGKVMREALDEWLERN